MILRAGMVAASALATAVAAQVAPYDLAGPRLNVTVTHGDGQGATTLPIAAVPNLTAGDRLTITADLPQDQSAHYLLVVAFLRGATNPPPKKWFFEGETWKAKGRTLRITVPDGAQQAIAFLAPATGGDFGTVVDAVRGRPGAFVRASQDLNQASLDRARLDAYVAGINARDTEGGVRLEQVSPLLARSLSIRLKDDCLTKPAELQAGCLTGGSDALVLSDGHSSSIAEALTGTPTDLAYQLSATPQGGYGYYSPYIGVVRDVARILGAFRTANYQYIPALATHDGDGLKLLLNAVPSFGKPKSVLVAALPAVAPPSPPPLRATHPGVAYCLTRPGLVLPVEGAPLIHATAYARDLALRVTAKDGREVDLPLVPDAEQGGVRVRTDALKPDRFDAELTGRLHGRWGFEPFEGPRFALQNPQGSNWRAPDKAGDGSGELVVGRDNPLPLAGAGGACVDAMTLKLANGTTRPVAWEAKKGGGVIATLPLAGVAPGDMSLRVQLAGMTEPATIPLTAYAEAGRIDGFTLHAGDRDGVLTGARLDMVKGLSVDGKTFRPGALVRVAGGDRLTMTADAVPALADGKSGRVTLADGRTAAVKVTLAPARPAATLIARTVTPPDGALTVALPDGVVSQRDRLTFSVRAGEATRFAPGDRVEVAAGDATATVPLRLQDAGVAIASLAPGEALGAGTAGPLRFRVVQGDAAGDWQPLGTLVRVPVLRAAACADRCTLSGRDLFLLSAAGPVTVPEGFTGETLTLPTEAAKDARLALTLRDDPAVAASVAVTAKGG
ncbi:hypothetical protein Q5H91_14405 [Sphingomonas sp. KR1UV-12]|uniref:Uncharacterized protein n=1 Tax=Sphingomonas aurea TaxID=3063994 RepID=A0ABT9EN73_9SPHN|nr:hypothetical protein [Sphingomonas sp. KR1UV-12]MDP1028412.1 hypothetical protein [Sphingomonas sp. KR1UV-12]